MSIKTGFLNSLDTINAPHHSILSKKVLVVLRAESIRLKVSGQSADLSINKKYQVNTNNLRIPAKYMRKKAVKQRPGLTRTFAVHNFKLRAAKSYMCC